MKKEDLTINASSRAGKMLVNSDTLAGVTAVKRIKEALRDTGATVDFWSNNTITICVLYMHTIKVAAKALKSPEALAAWTVERINAYCLSDQKRFYAWF